MQVWLAARVIVNRTVAPTHIILTRSRGSSIVYRFLSTGRFDDKGFSIVILNSRFTVSTKNLAFSGMKAGPLYTCILHADKPLGARSLNSTEALPIKVWHDRMGHLNWNSIKSIRSDDPPLIGINLDASDPPHETCPGCVAGKAKRRIFKSAGSCRTRSTYPIERIHADLAGPMEVESIGGRRYTCVFTCDRTPYTWVYLLKSKDKNPQYVQTFRKDDRDGRLLS